MNDPAAQRAFTLLEVLVALVIVALGLMAAFGQVNQTLSAASRLREKTFAHWVAMDQLTELRLRGEFPSIGEESDEVDMGGVAWRYTVKVIKTPEESLRRIDISVTLAERPESEISHLTGFIGRPTPGQAGAAPAAVGWYPLDPDAAPGEGDRR